MADNVVPIDWKIQPGPCIGCGAESYPLSMGGPGLCPACDCQPPEQRLKAIAAENRHNLRLATIYEEALKAISGPFDDPRGLDWRMQAYREAGGGYEGLQEIARAALVAAVTSEEQG